MSSISFLRQRRRPIYDRDIYPPPLLDRDLSPPPCLRLNCEHSGECSTPARRNFLCGQLSLLTDQINPRRTLLYNTTPPLHAKFSDVCRVTHSDVCRVTHADVCRVTHSDVCRATHSDVCCVTHADVCRVTGIRCVPCDWDFVIRSQSKQAHFRPL